MAPFSPTYLRGPSRILNERVQDPGQLLDTVDQARCRGGPTSALASTAWTRARPRAARRWPPGASAERLGCPPGRSRTAPRRPPRAVRRARASHSTRVDFSPAVPSTGLAAGRLDHLGDPVARRERRVGPLEEHDPGRRQPGHGVAYRVEPRALAAAARATASSRARWPGPGWRWRRRTSERVCGSKVTTSAVQPRWARASSTTVTSTAQTAHRSWVTTRSASGRTGRRRPGGRGPHPAPRRPRRRRRSRGGERPSGSAEVDTIVRPRAPPAGWSHSNVTPTTWSAGADREEDLGGRGEEGDDPHRRPYGPGHSAAAAPRISRWPTRP